MASISKRYLPQTDAALTADRLALAAYLRYALPELEAIDGCGAALLRSVIAGLELEEVDDADEHEVHVYS